VQFYQSRPTTAATDQVSGTLDALSEAFTRTTKPVLMTEFSLNAW